MAGKLSLAIFLSAAVALARAGGAAKPKAASPGVKSSGTCQSTQSISMDFSKLDVNGSLNGHGILLDKKEEARPGGDLNIALSIPCPRDDGDLVDAFTFTMSSVGSLLIYPQADLTIEAAKVVKIEVDELQISLRTTAPISVKDTAFKTPKGLEMTVTKGTATALGHSFALVGFVAQVPFNGYFTVDDVTSQLVLHLTDFDANFIVKTTEPNIEGNFRVTGWITALSQHASGLVVEHASRTALSLHSQQASAGDRRTRSAQASVLALGLAAVGSVGALLVAAARRSRAGGAALPLRPSKLPASESAAHCAVAPA